jgi:hypothetical protein
MTMENVQNQALMAPKYRRPRPAKTAMMHIRMEPSELEVLDEASAALGMSISAWARSVLIAEARKVLRRAREQ